jgi:transposase-like protein
MRSVVRSVRKRKKARVLGEVQVVRREEYARLEVDTKVELIRALVPLGLMHVQQLLEDEVEALVGARYARPAGRLGTRHGSNPGTVRLAGQRVPIRVPRVRGHGGELPLRSYAVLHGSRGEIDDLLLRRVLYGISCRNYEAAAAAVPGAIGLSSSTVSRRFVVASAAQLQAFQERELHGEDLVAVFLDGKTFADTTLVIAMGVRATGEKRFLGFVETDTENEAVLTPFLRSLLERGLDITRGLLVVVDGGKGLRAAVRKAFKALALVQRCQWHSVPGRAHSWEVRGPPPGKTFKPGSLRQVAAA